MQLKSLSVRLGISRNVFALGWVSFFNDIASEMLYPVVPIFLTAVIGAPIAIVGLIEGLAESTASILKVFSGWFSDRISRRKPLVVGGYACSSFSKLLFGLAVNWPMVLAARFIDRVGKGVRTAARDALIAENTSPENRGKAFGFHRGLDTLGAVAGPLLAILLLRIFSDNLRVIFYFAFLPSLLGVLLLLFFVREQGRAAPGRPAVIRFNWQALTPKLKIFLLVSFIFSLGNSSDAFLILRAKSLGLTTILTILAYVLYNITYALFSLPAGIISDRIGAARVLIAGFFIFGLVYLGFGFTHQPYLLYLLFPVYGCYMALTDGVGKAYIANQVSRETLGTAMGFYQTITGICAFLSSLAAGFLWTKIGAGAPFVFGGLTAFLAAFLFIILERGRKSHAEQ